MFPADKSNVKHWIEMCITNILSTLWRLLVNNDKKFCPVNQIIIILYIILAVKIFIFKLQSINIYNELNAVLFTKNCMLSPWDTK